MQLLKLKSCLHHLRRGSGYIPSQNAAQQRCVQTFGWRKPSLHFADRHFVLRCRTEEREAARNRTEHVCGGCESCDDHFLIITVPGFDSCDRRSTSRSRHPDPETVCHNVLLTVCNALSDHAVVVTSEQVPRVLIHVRVLWTNIGTG